MKLALGATLAAVAALFAASMLGTAVAEAPTTTTLRTVSVEGVAIVPIAQNADGATANAAYRQAMASAIADGQSKAEFLTGKVGATLGAVQTVTEGGGEVECTAGSEYADYEGERPDFGNAPSATPVYAAPNAASAAPPSTSVQPKRSTAKKRRKHKRPVAKKATAATCKLNAQVALVYVIG